MREGARVGELREAIEDLQSYLSDQVAPLLVLDSVELLLAQPPALGAEAIRAWVSGQVRAPGAALSVPDYLYHAVTKIQHLSRLRLVEPRRLGAWVDGVIDALVAQAPEVERVPLGAYLRQASETETSFAATLRVLHRPASAGVQSSPLMGGANAAASAAASVAASAQVSAEIAASVRQFTMLLSRLAPEGPLPTGGDAARLGAAELAPQLLAAAARSATSQTELEQRLASLGRAGLMTQSRLSDLFSTLSSGLPNWWIDDPAQGASVSAPIEAMHRIVKLAPDPAKAMVHFRELLRTAAQQFNERALPRAVQVLEVARRLVDEGKVERANADLILGSAHEELEPAQLMAQTQHAATLPLLRHLLHAYPALTPQGLLRALDDEPDRSRRRLWIALLEAHGQPARQVVLDRLEGSFSDQEQGKEIAWRQRNFVYLLHRIRPLAGEDPQREIRLSIRCAELANEAPLIREALINLGQRRHPEAEAALRQRLEQLDRALEQPASSPHDPPELRRMLGLVIAGLVRQATPTARRAIIEHGLQQKPHLGDTLERLEELGSVDLAEDPEIVERLVAALRTQLPVRVLGVNIRRQDGPYSLVRALQGTRSELVRQTFRDLVRRFPGAGFGQVAAAALEAWSTAPGTGTPGPAEGALAASPPTVSLSGDLDAFGLPELLQTLAQNAATGRLVLRNRGGELAGEMLLAAGALREARLRRLPQPDAFYQIMEVPQAGTFEFTRMPLEAVPPGKDGDVMGLMLEGMRRYDELQRARALAPDHVYLRGTGSRPTAPPSESNGAFIRDLWQRVREGASPTQCEDAINADSYRIRNLLGHWITEGALEVREAPENAPP